MNHDEATRRRAFSRDSGARSAVVYVHGILGCPAQFARLDSRVVELGMDAYALLLPGHGQGAREFCRSTHADWLLYAHREIHAVRQKYARLALIGHSMGCLLSLLYAAQTPVEGLVLINTPLRMHVTPRMLGLGARFMFGRAGAHESAYMQAYRESYGIDTPKLRQYPLMLRPMAGLRRLAAEARACLCDVQAPALILQSRRDETVSPSSARLLAQGLPNVRRVVFLENAYHSYYPPDDEDAAMQCILPFLKDVCDMT